MIYHFRAEVPEFDAVTERIALAVPDDTIIQWFREDFTLVGEASYEIAGRYVKNTRLLDPSSPAGERSLDEAREQVLQEAASDVVGESDQDGVVTFFAFSNFQPIKRRKTFPDEAAFLVEFFVDCLVSMPSALGTQDHIDLVKLFEARLADFLNAYKTLGLDDFARYVSGVGVSIEKATDDLETILSLYE